MGISDRYDVTTTGSPRLQFAQAPNAAAARVVLFGAGTGGAGFSPSPHGDRRAQASSGGRANDEDASRALIELDGFTPTAIRQADNGSPSLTEAGLDGRALFDLGDLDLAALSPLQQIDRVQSEFARWLAEGKIPFALGGDHLIKIGTLRAVLDHAPNAAVIYLDAHPDCRLLDEPRFDTVLHDAFRRGLSPRRTAIVGLRQVLPEEQRGLDHWRPGALRGMDFYRDSFTALVQKLDDALGDAAQVYVSLDLDGLDPTSAPAVEAPYPGGPSVGQVIALLHAVTAGWGEVRPRKLLGLDISEFLPALDGQRLTALSAVRLLKEGYACAML